MRLFLMQAVELYLKSYLMVTQLLHTGASPQVAPQSPSRMVMAAAKNMLLSIGQYRVLMARRSDAVSKTEYQELLDLCEHLQFAVAEELSARGHSIV